MPDPTRTNNPWSLTEGDWIRKEKRAKIEEISKLAVISFTVLAAVLTGGVAMSLIASLPITLLCLIVGSGGFAGAVALDRNDMPMSASLCGIATGTALSAILFSCLAGWLV